MAGESDLKTEVPSNEEKDSKPVTKKKQRGVLSRIWHGIFRSKNDDFEKRLQHISKEEAAILSRIRRRSRSWRGLSRNLIVFSVILEVVAVGYAIVTTRTLELDWKMRALRVLPMFLLPALSTVTYLALGSLTKLRERKDQSNLERLRTERQEKIDELKEKTKYYITQQLIQKYDTDPAAKAAAATVLASKLGADSGLKMHIGNDSEYNVSVGKSNDVQLVHSSGLRQRRPILTHSDGTIVQQNTEDMVQDIGMMDPENSDYDNQVVTQHHQPGSTPHDGGWFARIAAMLVGEDPTQCYALICGKCHMHNGLVRKEEFAYVTYYCPHCKALNKSNNLETVSGSDSTSISSSVTTSNINNIDAVTDPSADSKHVKSCSSEAVLETTDAADMSASGDPKPN